MERVDFTISAEQLLAIKNVITVYESEFDRVEVESVTINYDGTNYVIGSGQSFQVKEGRVRKIKPILIDDPNVDSFIYPCHLVNSACHLDCDCGCWVSLGIQEHVTNPNGKHCDPEE